MADTRAEFQHEHARKGDTQDDADSVDQVMSAALLRRLAKLEGGADAVAEISDADLDLCIGRLQRLVRQMDSDLIETNPDDGPADIMLDRIRRYGASSYHR